MRISTIAQPAAQLGRVIDELLQRRTAYDRIIFVSAFVALRTILRLRERLLQHMKRGTGFRIIAGIDLGGTSREVLDELLRWKCEAFVCHNPIARSTFHPKIYLFEGPSSATLIVGSNNLTDGGFYTNCEAAARFDFDLPSDAAQYEEIAGPLQEFLAPQGRATRPLSQELVAALSARGELPSESERRERRKAQSFDRPNNAGIPNPFGLVRVPVPPLLSNALRKEEPPRTPSAPRPTAQPASADVPRRNPPSIVVPAARILVWKKILPKTDALQVEAGSHPVGGVRLTQAKFENPPGKRIDQTIYFRQLFSAHDWESEPGRRPGQEHTFIPMRITIRGRDYGVGNFEISHKPSGEAGQDNYTTILRWGRAFTPIVLHENIAGREFSLYEIAEPDADFLIEIS